MLPSKRFELIFNKVRKCAEFNGICTLADKCSPNYFAVAYTGIAIVTYFGLAGFTAFAADLDDLDTIMEHTAISLVVIQVSHLFAIVSKPTSVIYSGLGNLVGLFKLFNVYKNGKDIYQMNICALDIIKENEKLEGELQALAYKCVHGMETLFKVAVFLYAGSILVLEAMPMVILIVTGEQVLLARYSLPLFSPTVEFFLTYILQVAQQCIFASGSLALDYLFVLQIVHVVMLVDIFKVKLSAIDRELVKKDKNVKLISSLLIDIIRWHQEFCRYTKLTKKCFNLHASVEVVMSTLSISVMVVTLMISGWLGSYPLLIFFYGTLFVFCILGTVYETQQETMSQAIYNFKWYLLDARDQKLVLFMLARTQQPTVLDVFGVSPFNVETAVGVTQTIYSYITMMASFMK